MSPCMCLDGAAARGLLSVAAGFPRPGKACRLCGITGDAAANGPCGQRVVLTIKAACATSGNSYRQHECPFSRSKGSQFRARPFSVPMVDKLPGCHSVKSDACRTAWLRDRRGIGG